MTAPVAVITSGFEVVQVIWLPYAEPVGEVETRLAELWAAVLEIRPVGRHDGFTALGGTSLMATRLLARIHGEFAVHVTVPGFFAAHTVAGLARLITDGPRAERPRLTTGGPNDEVSAGQRRLWFLTQLDAAANAAYTVPAATRLRGPLDVTALREALNAVVADHDTLRTGFHLRDGELVIVDYKTGKAPAQKAVDAGFALQLGLLGVLEQMLEQHELARAELQHLIAAAIDYEEGRSHAASAGPGGKILWPPRGPYRRVP